MKYDIKILKSAVKIVEGSTNKKFIFTRSTIQYFRNAYFVRTTNLSSFHFFKITIDTQDNECHISISNFDKLIETIRWKSIKGIPDILDALCGLYQLVHFDNQRIDDNIDVLIYHSKIGRKSRQLFKVEKWYYQFKIQFFNTAQTLVHFNFINSRLFLKDEIIPFQHIHKIVIYLDKMETSSSFDVLAIEVFLKNDSIVSIIEMKNYRNRDNKLEPISWIHGKMVFSAVIELLEQLHQQPELDNIPIKLEIQ